VFDEPVIAFDRFGANASWRSPASATRRTRRMSPRAAGRALRERGRRRATCSCNGTPGAGPAGAGARTPRPARRPLSRPCST
jgi:hypothetical protein